MKMKIEKDVAVAANIVLLNRDAFKLVNNAFAFFFKEARLSTTGGCDIEHNTYVGQFSASMRALTSKCDDLPSDFDEIDESEAKNENTTLKHLLFNNHDVDVDKKKIKGQLPLEHIFRFCKTFKMNTKHLGFLLIFKTADLQDIIYTTPGDDIKKILISFFLCSNIHSQISDTINV